MTDTQPKSNPLVDDIAEKQIGMEIAIPTLGMFYYPDVLREGTNPEKLMVYPISSYADMMLKDPILLASGRSVPKMIQTVCPSILRPDDLADIDIEAILLACRLISFGPTLKFQNTCTNPDHEEGVAPCRHEATVSLNLIQHIQKYAPMDPTMVSEQYRVELDELGQVVYLRPMPYAAILKGIRSAMASEKGFEKFGETRIDDLIMDDTMIEVYANMIDHSAANNIDVLVDCIFYAETRNKTKINDPEMIREWLWRIPSELVGKIRERVSMISRETAEKSTVEYECPQCHYNNRVQIQLDAQKLFFSGRDSSNSTPPSEPVAQQDVGTPPMMDGQSDPQTSSNSMKLRKHRGGPRSRISSR